MTGGYPSLRLTDSDHSTAGLAVGKSDLLSSDKCQQVPTAIQVRPGNAIPGLLMDNRSACSATSLAYATETGQRFSHEREPPSHGGFRGALRSVNSYMGFASESCPIYHACPVHQSLPYTIRVMQPDRQWHLSAPFVTQKHHILQVVTD